MAIFRFTINNQAISDLTDDLRERATAIIRQVTAQVANATRDRIQQKARETLHATFPQYKSAIKTYNFGSTWIIKLDKEAKHLEDGYGPFDMIAQGLVKNAQNVRTKKDGSGQYIRVPFRFGAGMDANSRGGKNRKVQSGTLGDLKNDFLGLVSTFDQRKPSFLGADPGKVFSGTGISISSRGHTERTGNPFGKDVSTMITRSGQEKPLIGAVYSIRQDGDSWTYKNMFGEKASVSGVDFNSNLSGLTKIQTLQPNGKAKASYMTWRTATDPRNAMVNSKPKWMHPGFRGVKAFEGAQEFADAELDKMLTEAFKDFK